MMSIDTVRMAGRNVLPLVEGGKGVSVSTGISAGHWAAAGGVGTVSAVNADSYDEAGNRIPQIYSGRTRRERHEELIRYAIDGGITQVKIAREIAGSNGMLNVNLLWEMGGAELVIEGILEEAPADRWFDLRRWHALSSVRNCGTPQRALLSDCFFCTGIQRPVEARLSQDSRASGGCGLRRSLACGWT